MVNENNKDNSKNIEMLDEKQIDQLMEYSIKFDDASDDNIRNKFYNNANFNTKKINMGKYITVFALASTFVFSTLVYANVIDLSVIHRKLLGDNEDYIKDKVVNVDVCDVDNGIEARLVSAFMTNENEINVIFTLKDTTGQGRITKDSRIDRYSIKSEANSDDLSETGSGILAMIDFDEETDTAVHFLSSYRGTGFDGNITLKIDDITKGVVSPKYDLIENIDLYAEVNGYKPETMSQTDVVQGGGFYNKDIKYEDMKKMDLLMIDEISIPFETIDWAEISNIGFVDGALHVQVKEFVNARNRSFGGLDIENGNTKYTNDIQFSFYEESEFDDKSRLGYIYHEYVYSDITDVSQLKDSIFTINYMDGGENLPVSFTLEFAKPDELTSNVVAENVEVTIANTEVIADEISLSPLGVDVLIKREEPMEFYNSDVEDVYVVYKSGDKEKLARGSITNSLINDVYNIRVSYVPVGKLAISLNEVDKFVINGSEFEVE